MQTDHTFRIVFAVSAAMTLMTACSGGAGSMSPSLAGSTSSAASIDECRGTVACDVKGKVSTFELATSGEACSVGPFRLFDNGRAVGNEAESWKTEGDGFSVCSKKSCTKCSLVKD